MRMCVCVCVCVRARALIILAGAGIYIPMTAVEIAKGNDAGVEPHINLVGLFVGNGCTGNQTPSVRALCPPPLGSNGLFVWCMCRSPQIHLLMRDTLLLCV